MSGKRLDQIEALAKMLLEEVEECRKETGHAKKKGKVNPEKVIAIKTKSMSKYFKN